MVEDPRLPSVPFVAELGPAQAGDRETSAEKFRRYRDARSFGVLSRYVQDAKRSAQRDSDTSVSAYYRRLAEVFPLHIPIQAQQLALEQIREIQEKIAEQGENPKLVQDYKNSREILTALNIGRVASAVDLYAAHERNDADDMFAAAITEVYRKTVRMPSYNHRMSITVHREASLGILQYIRERDGVSVESLRRGDEKTTVIPEATKDNSSKREIAFPQPNLPDLDMVEDLRDIEAARRVVFTSETGHMGRELLQRQDRVISLRTGQFGAPMTFHEIADEEPRNNPAVDKDTVTWQRAHQLYNAGIDRLRKSGLIGEQPEAVIETQERDIETDKAFTVEEGEWQRQHDEPKKSFVPEEFNFETSVPEDTRASIVDIQTYLAEVTGNEHITVSELLEVAGAAYEAYLRQDAETPLEPNKLLGGLATLSARQVEVLWYVQHDALMGQTIAQRSFVSPGTVSRALKTAREKIASVVEDRPEPVVTKDLQTVERTDIRDIRKAQRDEAVEAILAETEGNLSVREIAARLGTAPGTIYASLKRITGTTGREVKRESPERAIQREPRQTDAGERSGLLASIIHTRDHLVEITGNPDITVDDLIDATRASYEAYLGNRVTISLNPAHLLEAFTSLSYRQAEVLWHVEHDSLTRQKIGEQTGTTHQAVTNALKHARLKIASAIEGTAPMDQRDTAFIMEELNARIEAKAASQRAGTVDQDVGGINLSGAMEEGQETHYSGGMPGVGQRDMNFFAQTPEWYDRNDKFDDR